MQDDLRERSLDVCVSIIVSSRVAATIVIKRRPLSEISKRATFDFGCCSRVVFAATKIYMFHKCGFGLQEVERTETNIFFQKCDEHIFTQNSKHKFV